jgi:lysozyme
MNPHPRIVIAVLTFSAAGLVGLAIDEGYTEVAVPDPVRGAHTPTLGFGMTEGVKMGDTTTPVAALQRKLAYLQSGEQAFKKCVQVPLHQTEFDLYTNLYYNIGPARFCSSTLVKKLNAQDYAGACEQILKFKYVNGFDCSTPGNKICRGLWTRRLKLYRQCRDAQ